jgi:hypothetical protein
MSNRVRYAWGHSPFGDFIVAMSDQNLVAFEFPLCSSDAVDALRRRFPDAVIEEDAAGLAPTITTCATTPIAIRPRRAAPVSRLNFF